MFFTNTGIKSLLLANSLNLIVTNHKIIIPWDARRRVRQLTWVSHVKTKTKALHHRP